jgi:hypothetical protein
VIESVFSGMARASFITATTPRSERQLLQSITTFKRGTCTFAPNPVGQDERFGSRGAVHVNSQKPTTARTRYTARDYIQARRRLPKGRVMSAARRFPLQAVQPSPSAHAPPGANENSAIPIPMGTVQRAPGPLLPKRNGRNAKF